MKKYIIIASLIIGSGCTTTYAQEQLNVHREDKIKIREDKYEKKKNATKYRLSKKEDKIDKRKHKIDEKIKRHKAHY